MKENLGKRFIELPPFLLLLFFASIHERNRREGEAHSKRKSKRICCFFCCCFNITSKPMEEKRKAKKKFHDLTEKFHCSDRSRSKIHATEQFDESADLFKIRIGGVTSSSLCGVFFSSPSKLIIWFGWVGFLNYDEVFFSFATHKRSRVRERLFRLDFY